MPPKRGRRRDHQRLSETNNDNPVEPPEPERDGGVSDELRRQLVLCGTDLYAAQRHPSKTLSSALFLFFATLFSTVALGAHIQQETSNRVGLSEYLLANSLGGAFHALFGAQPLLILRPTGPITAIMGKLSILADSAEVDFYLLLAATGICVSLWMFLIAFLRLSTLAQRFTPSLWISLRALSAPSMSSTA